MNLMAFTPFHLMMSGSNIRIGFPFASLVMFSLLLPLPGLAQVAETTLPSQPFSEQILPAPVNAFSSAYILGIGDQLDITVFDYEEFTGEKVVLPDGTIIMPMLGGVVAAGKTSEQLAQDLTNRLQTLLVNPVVTVRLTSLRPVVVNVAGEVQRPGTIQLRGSTSGSESGSSESLSNPTLANALIAAGGITSDADIRQITVKRYSPNQATAPITVNLWDAIQSDTVGPMPILQDGDSIYVPRLQENAAINRRLVARSQFAPETVRVRVVGEVNSPGEVQVPPNSSISSAVAIAGGPTEDARLSETAFVRLNEDGQVERQIVDLKNLVDSYQVQDGDVVIVPKEDASSVLDFAGRLVGPLGLILNLLIP